MNNNFAEKISKTSPLYEFWRSSQNSDSNQLRLCKANILSPASDLYVNEPYKWETLYQCILRELIKGNLDSLNGLKVLLETLTKEERENVLKKIIDQGILESELLAKLNNTDATMFQRKINLIRFSKIFISIFFNPYNLNLKQKKKYIYERTGGFIYSLRSRSFRWL